MDERGRAPLHRTPINQEVALQRSLGERAHRVGPILYVSSLQYFIVQLVVSLRWSPAYSLRRDTISDLGNTACGTFNGRYVCSPLHALMNASFIALGVTMIAGSVLTLHHVGANRARRLGFVATGIGGLGVVVVGVFPENSVPTVHGLGAALPFVIGNLGVIVLGVSLAMPRVLRVTTLTLGSVALVALLFYASTQYLALGEGGMERIVAYPQTVWLILFGAYLVTKEPHTSVIGNIEDSGI